MIFPFEITRHYKLLETEFGEYKSTEIIDRIYDFLRTEGFKRIEKKNNTIEIVGNYKNAILYNRDQMTQCIDKGLITIEEHGVSRTIIYKFQSLYCFIFLQLSVIVPLFIISIFVKSLNFALVISVVAFCIMVGIWIFYIIVQPSTISAPIEIMRTESIRRKLGKNDYSC